MVIAHLRGEYMLADLLTKLMSGQVYAKLKSLWGLQMLVRGTDLRKATIAAAVIMVAASLQGLAENPNVDGPSTPGFLCSQDGVCMASSAPTAMFLAQWIEAVLDHWDLGMYLAAVILLWEALRFGLKLLHRWWCGKRAVVLPQSATLYTTTNGNCMHASSDCEVCATHNLRPERCVSAVSKRNGSLAQISLGKKNSLAEKNGSAWR